VTCRLAAICNLLDLSTPSPQAGKTVVANFMAGERTELEWKGSGELGPTVGVRILKFDRTISGIGTLPVELWDVSGNEQ